MIMKLKRSQPGMSYDEVRYKQTDGKSGSLEPSAVDPESPPETSDVSAPDPVLDPTDLQPVENVPVFEHDDLDIPAPAEPETTPATSSSISLPAPDNAGTSNVSRKVETPRPAKRQTQPDRSAPPVARTDDERRPQSVIVRGFIAEPANGVSATFDKIAPVYGENAAMRHLLDVALASLFAALEAGEVDRIQGDPIYSGKPKKRQITRNVSNDHFARLANMIDPSNILKPGTVGRMIVQGALNRFISNERDQKG